MASDPETIQSIRDLLESQSTMTLATVDEHGVPDATPLFYLLQDDMTLYWLSSATSRHSVNLCRQPQTAVSVYVSVSRWELIRGVQMEGTAREVTDRKRCEEVISAYRNRFQLGAMLSLAISQSSVYEFRPAWLRYIDNSRGFGYQIEIKR